MKLRALPNDGGFANDQSATTSTDQSIGETTITAVTKSRLSDIGGGSSGNSNSNSINDNNFNDINSHNTPLAVLSTEIPNDRGTTQTHILASRSAAGVTDNANYGKEVGNCSSRASLEQYREDPRGEHAGSALESATSCVGSLQVSTSTSNASSTYRYGRHLSTLTLGRIADGFRRDCHVFPVDLKGRGEGRAVEARAVMQVQHTCMVLGS